MYTERIESLEIYTIKILTLVARIQPHAPTCGITISLKNTHSTIINLHQTSTNQVMHVSFTNYDLKHPKSPISPFSFSALTIVEPLPHFLLPFHLILLPSLSFTKSFTQDLCLANSNIKLKVGFMNFSYYWCCCG